MAAPVPGLPEDDPGEAPPAMPPAHGCWGGWLARGREDVPTRGHCRVRCVPVGLELGPSGSTTPTPPAHPPPGAGSGLPCGV